MFNKFTPLPDGALRSSILRLADREDVPVDDVLVADASRRTTTLNAYVSGFWGTRRVVLYDNLLDDLPPDQIRSVVAHELGHARHHDVLLGTGLGSLGALAGVCLLALVLDAPAVRRRAGVTGAGDPAVAALVLAAVAVGSFLSSPAQNTVSRAIEARADRAALEATDDPVSFDGLQRQLALHSLADPSPPAITQFWFGSHPTVLQRIGIAEAVTGKPYRAVTRTLVVTNDFPPRRGGIETWVRSLCDEHDPADVVVHTARMPGDSEYDARLPFAVVRDPARTLLPTPAATARVADTLRRTGCERVVFGASAPLGLMTPALRRAGARHVRAMTHGHEVWWAAVPGTRQALRRIGDDVDELTYVSDFCAERIGKALSEAGRARLQKLVPTVDTNRFRPAADGAEVRDRWGIPAEAPVAVCVARLVRRKGQDTLVRIWPDVRSEVPGAVLLLVGDGPDRCRIERMVARRGLEDAVVLAGAVSHDEVPAHLAAGDVFAMPVRSRRFGLEVEAFGIAYLEAAACGLRVVGGKAGGAPEAMALARAFDTSQDMTRG